MGKLRASLFSFRARGRIGGHRGAPGAPLAPVGPMWHKDLLGLGADDHLQYPLLLGRAGGQTLIGGTAALQSLKLQSTAHATRGVVWLEDLLHLADGRVSDPGHTVRLTLSAGSPHFKASGQCRLGDNVGIGVDPTLATGLNIQPSLQGTGILAVIRGNPTVQIPSGMNSVYGLLSQATTVISAGAWANPIAGLYFTALASGAGSVQNLYAAWVRAGLQFYSGPAPNVWGLKVRSPMLFFTTYPTTAYGVDIDDQGFYGIGTHNAVGLRIADQTNTSGNKYLIEAGPATPYLRLVGGAAPGVGVSNLWVNFNGILKQIQEDAVNTAGAGFRRLRVVN